MTLPFNNSTDRKYQCFCCGVQNDTLEEMKDHIEEEHELGRDYIICPYCFYPVRDLRTHCKVKHSSRPMPKQVQMKALVWRDFSAKKGRKKAKFKEGYYESTKMSRKIHYRSGYELKVYECLDADLDVKVFGGEPFKIPYIFEGKQHDYNPDIIVNYIDGHTEVWEVKPSDQTTLPKNEAKWYAAKEACKQRGWDFKVITEKGIRLLQNKVKKQRKILNESD